MVDGEIDEFVRLITPKVGDPTYSLLKAHLLFEELLRSYLSRVLPHADALDGACLTFAQLLAVARAGSLYVRPDHWIWKAIADLNRLRNMLSHEARPKAIAERLDAYIEFILENTTTPLPPPVSSEIDGPDKGSGVHLYTKFDIVIVGLYGTATGILGFECADIIERQVHRQREIDELKTAGANIDL